MITIIVLITMMEFKKNYFNCIENMSKKDYILMGMNLRRFISPGYITLSQV